MSGWFGGTAAVTGSLGIGALLVLVVATRRRALVELVLLIAVIAIAAALSGALASQRHEATLGAAVPEGMVDLVGIVADEPVMSFGEVWVVVRSAVLRDGSGALPPIAIRWLDQDLPRPGDVVAAAGRLRNAPDTVRGDPVAGRLAARDVAVVRRTGSVLHRVANAMRGRVDEVLSGPGADQPDALLAGFLIGNTSDVAPDRLDDLRSAGLSHFVAVSGSNVALFLGAWWLLLTPLAGPRVRAAVGLVGLALFAVVTRWEPSVLRASVMLGLVLVGRLAGVALDPVVALGWACAALLLIAGDLAASVGFQLSVCATVGVMVGARLVAERKPRLIWAVLGATAGAQVAVAPIVLIHFGSVPLMAPAANLLAAPLVTLATGCGGIAVALGGGPLLGVARWFAGAVLDIARLAAGWPQLDAAAFTVVVLMLGALRPRSTRPIIGIALVAASVLLVAPPQSVDGATITALDVGQGDAIVVSDGGHSMLIDGGRDPAVLRRALDRRGIGGLDLVVATHGDADHAGGLVGLVDDGVGELWVPAFGSRGEILDRVVAEATDAGVTIREVGAGTAVVLGRLRVSVLGPQRRYKSDNDGAIVLWVEAGSTSVLLPSDIEAVAQRELPDLRPDVMVVPHHGAATTDVRWLEATVGHVAIISVGANTYGHPSPEILRSLAARGVAVVTTRAAGDVVIPLLP